MKKFFVFFIIATAYLFGTTPAYAQCYLVNNGSGSIRSNKAANSVIASFSLGANNNGKVSFSMTSNNKYSPTLQVQTSMDNTNWTNAGSTIEFSNGTKNNQSVAITYNAQYVRFVKVDKSTFSYDYSVSDVYVERISSLSSSINNMEFDELFVNGSSSKTATITFSNTGTSLSATSTSADFIPTFDNTAIDCSGTRTLTVKFAPKSEGSKSATIKVEAGTKSVTLSVSGSAKAKATPTFTWNTAFSNTVYVDQTIVPVLSSNSDATASVLYEISGFVPSGSNNEGVTMPYIDAGGLHCSQAGTFKLTASQAAGTNYLAHSEEKMVTVVKYANPITVTFNGNTYASNTFNMAYGVGASVLVSTANEANTVVVSQTAGADLATYYADQKAVYTSYKSGAASWSVSQPENYKYEAGSATFSVNIAPAQEGDVCYVFEELEEKSVGINETYTYASTFSHGNVLTFEARKSWSGIGNLKVDLLVNGEWVNVFDKNPDDSYESFTIAGANVENATKMKFYTEWGASYSKYVRNVRITRKTYLTTSITAAEGLRMPDCRLGESKTATFNVVWSRPSTSHNIHIESDNDHFTVSPAIIENVGCNNGTTAITVTYTPVEASEETATLTIYDESEVITLNVNGKVVDKFTPEIDWLIPAIVKPNTSYVDLSNIVTSNSASSLVITSSDASIASYDAATQTLQTYDKEGFVTFTVSQTANTDFYAITLQFSVFVTDKESQMCILYEDATKHTLTDVANANVGEFDINLDAPVSMISADIWKYSSIATGSIVVKWYDGNDVKLGEKEVGVEKLSTNAKNFVMQLPRDTRKLSFKVKGTLSKYVQNIKVYRAQYLEHNAVLTDGRLNFGSADYLAEPTVHEFDILYSGAGDFSVSSTNNELFTVESVSETIDCANAWGTKHISVAYNHNIVSNDHTATLNAQLGTMVFSIPLVGATDRPSEAVFIGDVNDDWTKPENWLGGVLPAENTDIVIKGDLVISDGEQRTVNSLVIESTGSVLVVNNGSLIVNGAGSSADGTYGDLTVNKNGSVVVNSDYLTVNNLIFEASPEDNKGAIVAGSIKVVGSAYIDINMDNSGVLNDKQYYSFSVPFAVNSVERYNTATSAWESAASLYRAYSYSESARATQGKTNACWKNVSTFAPGVFYLIEFADSKANTYRFHWAGNADGILNSEPTALNVTSTGTSEERGWNGIGNTGLTYASLSGVTIMQSLSEDGKSFESFTSTTPMAIGKAAFVQVAESGSISWIEKSVPASVAARRVAAEENELFNLHIAPLESDIFADQIFLTTSEDAQPLYEIGRDVAKMSMGTAARAQMWIDAYGKKLVAYDALLQDEQATATLGFSAPKAGDYTISLENDFGADVYLTYEDKKIANLSLSPYTISLNAGDNSGYGLLINRAARVTTDFMQTESQTLSAEKKLINGQLFILSAGHLFDAQGRMMK